MDYVISIGRRFNFFRSFAAALFFEVEALDIVLEEGARSRPFSPAFSPGELPPLRRVPMILDGVLCPSG